jgi:hypothetical protein
MSEPKREPGARMPLAFGSDKDLIKQLEQEQKQHNAKIIKLDTDFKNQEFRVNHWKNAPRTHEQRRFILRELIDNGITASDFAEVTTEKEAENKLQALKDTKAKEKTLIDDAERKKFENQYKRYISYLDIPMYEKNLRIVYQDQQPTTEKLNELVKWTLENSMLKREEKTLGITWLQSKINEQTKHKSEGLGQKFSSFCRLP